MITPPNTSHTESYSGLQSHQRSTARTAMPTSSPYREDHIHLSLQKNLKEGVALSKRILMGNREACLTLQSIVPLEAADLKMQVEELLHLIDLNRSFAPMSDDDAVRKINLQSLIAEAVQSSTAQK